MTLGDRASREILEKLRKSNCMFLHNSSERDKPFIYFAGRGRRRSFYELSLSEDEQKMFSDAAKVVQRKTRQLVKGHRNRLNNLLGKLKQKFDVEFTTIDDFRSDEMPLGINLKDKK